MGSLYGTLTETATRYELGPIWAAQIHIYGSNMCPILALPNRFKLEFILKCFLFDYLPLSIGIKGKSGEFSLIFLPTFFFLFQNFTHNVF